MIGEMKFSAIEPPDHPDWLKFGHFYEPTDYPDFLAAFPAWYDAINDKIQLPNLDGYLFGGTYDTPGIEQGDYEITLTADQMPEQTFSYTGAEGTVINGGLEAPAPAALPIPLTGTVGNATPNPIPLFPVRFTLYAVIRGRV